VGIEDVARAWEAGADRMVLRSEEVASWSFAYKPALCFARKYGNGVVHHWDMPIENSYVDQITDDGKLITRYWNEHEVFGGPISNNVGILTGARDHHISFEGKEYTWEQRAEFLKIWRAKHPKGPSGYVPSSAPPPAKTVKGK
jgi:hypothetical protein